MSSLAEATGRPSGKKDARSVFLDPTGRRWRRARIVLVVAGLLVALLATIGIGYVESPLHVDDLSERQVISIADTGTNTPVIGDGPLERVLKLQRTTDGGTTVVQGIEPWTGEVLATLTAEQITTAADASYVIQRYGYTSSTSKTISLTFDDGPDGEVTSQLLDVLSANQVPATFFVVGTSVVENAEVLQRMVREGHALGVHTMTHPDLTTEPDWREQAELIGTERLIRALTGTSASIWRMPYTSPQATVLQEGIDGILRAQRLGYTHASYDFDTLDWEHNADPNQTSADIPLPDLSTGENITLLLHDAGGDNRTRTVEYVQRLITYARANGYTFTTMTQASSEIATANATVETDTWDIVHWVAAVVGLAWPVSLMSGLFILALVLVLLVGVVQAVLAVRRARRRRAVVYPSAADCPQAVSVVLAAYNEEPVIARTVRTILASEYPILEVVVVDDGSSDLTADVVDLLAEQDDRVRLVRQANSGKAPALNAAVAVARGEVIVTLDADTVITPTTVGHLVRHFAVDPDRRLGGVAGVVRVGNRNKNLLTRWQALEYVTQIGLDRSAQDALGAITIIPGACAAWRREAILDAGGFVSETLAEDCDLALTLHRRGWRVTQDDDALAYTEAPETVDDLLKQRERWTYGTLQAMYKHRELMFNRRFGALGWFVLPSYALSLVVPWLMLPLVTLVTLQTLQDGGFGMLVAYFGAFLLVHVALAAVAVRLLGDSFRHLLVVPVYRLANEPLRAYLLYTSVHRALTGRGMGWNKLLRTGSLDTTAPAEDTSAPAEDTPAPELQTTSARTR